MFFNFWKVKLILQYLFKYIAGFTLSLFFDMTYLDRQDNTGQVQWLGYHRPRSTSSVHRSSLYCDTGRSYTGQSPEETRTHPRTVGHWRNNLNEHSTCKEDEVFSFTGFHTKFSLIVINKLKFGMSSRLRTTCFITITLTFTSGTTFTLRDFLLNACQRGTTLGDTLHISIL